ncbi:MAG: 16S rRNA (cytosine(967)-C(5))-methyltransferase RsmB [Proteobacteria bacterium]|nr:16S rRNA (cytosine(967)-C(5))-methyltransferase RsmB [Pseudomonadota bacterium]
MKPRTLAAQIIHTLLQERRSLSDLLPEYFEKLDDARDQGLVQELCFGVCRWYEQLKAIADSLLNQPCSDPEVEVVILLGLYQLLYLRMPSHAIVSETVEVVHELKKTSAKGLVNAILRNFLRQKEEILKKLEGNLVAETSHPKWFIDQIKKDWPSEWQTILAANNQYPPMNLRVNRLHGSREIYLKRLGEQKIGAHASKYCENGITLQEAVPVFELPGFKEGDVSVQDLSAQFAAELLDLKPNQFVLDACAAPGGKTTHILESEPKLSRLVAVEQDPKRLTRIQENCERLKLSAELICADANQIEQWWDGQYFDRILLDAPCSATGVIRRHPDIKLLRQKTDIAALARAQLELLKSCWKVLKPGGRLVYVTCSVLSEENVWVLERFISLNADAKALKIEAIWGIPRKIGRQILPGWKNMDGFYYAILNKT